VVSCNGLSSPAAFSAKMLQSMCLHDDSDELHSTSVEPSRYVDAIDANGSSPSCLYVLQSQVGKYVADAVYDLFPIVSQAVHYFRNS
jgi:hypothetical protein